MRGYELIVVVNGILLLFIGLFGFLNGAYIERKADRCNSGDAADCARQSEIGSTVRVVSSFVAPLGILLLGAGAILSHRRRHMAPPNSEDPFA
jgi:hypothetical protein